MKWVFNGIFCALIIRYGLCGTPFIDTVRGCNGFLALAFGISFNSHIPVEM